MNGSVLSSICGVIHNRPSGDPATVCFRLSGGLAAGIFSGSCRINCNSGVARP